MVASATLTTLKSRSRQRADMENSTFIGDAELTVLINGSYADLYDIMVQTYEDYYISSTTFTLVTADVGVYALPSDFSKLKGLEILEGGIYRTLKAYSWSTRNLNVQNITPTASLAYRLVGNNLRLQPDTAAAGSFRLWYVPAFTPLASANDVVDSHMTRNGWEDYIVIDAAIKMLMKEESNTDGLQAEKARLLVRIQSSAGQRDLDQPEFISDINHIGDIEY